MSFDAQAGNFAMPTSTGTAQVVTGLGFDPKIVLFMPTEQTADGVKIHAQTSFGAAVSGSERQHATAADEDGQSMSDATGHSISTGCIRINIPGGSSQIYEADLESMDTGAFTIDVTTAPGTALRCGYLALGGSDLTDVAVGVFTGQDATGDQDITSLSFQPDCVIFWGAWDTANDSGNNHAIFHTGWAISSTERGTLGQNARNNVSTTITGRLQETDACIKFLDRNNNIDGEADFVTFLSNGFRVNWSTAAGEIVHFAAFKGGQYATGDLVTKIGTGTFSETGAGFQPIAAMFGSFCNAAAAGAVNGLERSMGFATASGEQFTQGAASEHNVVGSDADQFSDDALVYTNYDFNQTLEGSIAFSQFESDGFELDQVDADPSANQMIYLLFGEDASVAAIPNKIVQVGQAVNRASTY